MPAALPAALNYHHEIPKTAREPKRFAGCLPNQGSMVGKYKTNGTNVLFLNTIDTSI